MRSAGPAEKSQARLTAAGIVLAALSFITPAFAQLDYDTCDIFQGGNVVGVIYVPPRGPDTSV